MSQEDFVKDVDLSVKGLQRIEAGELVRIRAKTLGELNRAARWTQGSAQDILDGGEPTPLPEPGSDRYPAELFARDLRSEIEHEIMAIRGETDSVLWSYVIDRRKRLYDEKRQRI